MAGRQYQQVAYGLTSPLIAENPTPVIAKRNPTTSDFAFPTTIWTNTLTNAIYILASISNNQANWVLVEVGGGAGVFASLTVTPGPISLTGTTTINTAGGATTTIGTGGTGAVNIGNATGNTAVTGSLTATGNIASSGGSVSANTTVTAGTGITSTTGNIVATAGGVFAGTVVSAGTTITAGTGITSTTGNIVATAGQVNAGTTMTAGTGITSTTGNIVATAGQVNAGTTITAGTGITSTAGNIRTAAVGAGFLFSNNVAILSGTGDPTGAVAAPQGSLYLNTAGSGTGNRAYINTDGITAWTAITTAS